MYAIGFQAKLTHFSQEYDLCVCGPIVNSYLEAFCPSNAALIKQIFGSPMAIWHLLGNYTTT